MMKLLQQSNISHLKVKGHLASLTLTNTISYNNILLFISSASFRLPGLASLFPQNSTPHTQTHKMILIFITHG